MMSGLLIGISHLNEFRFRKETADNLDARRQIFIGETHRDSNGGKAGVGRDQLAVIASRTAQVSQFPGRIVPGGIDDEIHTLLCHGIQHCLAEGNVPGFMVDILTGNFIRGLVESPHQAMTDV